MFSSLAILASSALLFSNARPLPLEERDHPANWWTTGLEPYADYHTRYMEIGCPTQHNTTFFDQCCHPLLRSETLEKNRPAQCNPANHKGDDNGDKNGDDGDCEDDNHSPVPVPNPAQSGNNNNDDDCEDDEDTPAPAPKAAPKPAPPPPAPKPAAPKPAAPKPEAPKEPAPAPKPPVNAAPAPKPNPPSPPPPPPPANNNDFHTGGFGTWFTQNGVAGACGTVHQDSDHVVALDARTYGNTGAQSPLCGKTIEITDTDTGKTFDGVVADACPTCTNPSSVDMSTSLFQQFAPLSKGEINLKWRLKN